MKKTLGIYARQSVDKGTGGSIEDQINHGKAKAQKLNMEFAIYIDRGKSAHRDNFENRPEFQRLLKDISDFKINAVFVYDHSRLTRNDDANHAIKQIFKSNNITLHTVIDGETDYSNPMDVFQSQIRAFFNMQVVDATTAKIKSVLKLNVSKGRAHSGVIKPFGYTSDENKMLIIENSEAAIVKEIYALCIQGFGSKSIASKLNEKAIPTKTHRLIVQKKLGIPTTSSFNENNIDRVRKWAPNTVLSILKNPLYKGKRLHKGEFYDAPKIIEEIQWDKAQTQIKKNRNAPGVNKFNYLLKNIIFCGRCKSAFCGRTRESKKDHYYYCASRVKRIPKCGIRSINIDTIENLVWAVVSNSSVLISHAKKEADALKMPEIINNLSKEKKKFETKLKTLKQANEEILSLISGGLITIEDAKKQIEKNNTNFNNLKVELDAVNYKLYAQQELNANIDFAEIFLKDWEKTVFTNDFDLKRKLVLLFVDNVMINFDDAKETYYIEIKCKIPTSENIKSYRIDKLGNASEHDAASISDTLTSEMVWWGER